MELPKRKTTRLQTCDYSTPGFYFITVCTKNKQCLLSNIVGTGVLDGPQSVLSQYGLIADKHIKAMRNFYEHIVVESYVIMPNHIHFLFHVIKRKDATEKELDSKQHTSGPSRTPVPTQQNSTTAQFISTFKRFCNKDYGKNIWQYRSHDRIVRNGKELANVQCYIETNPQRWTEDCFYIKKNERN